MKFGIQYGLIFISLLAQVGPAYALTELARINTTVISLEEFNKKYDENSRFFQYNRPSKKTLLDNIVKRELAIQEAKRLKLDHDPEVIDRINTVLYNSLLEKNLAKKFDAIHISDDEAKVFYDKNPEIRTSHIFVALRPDASPEEAKKAWEKIKRIHSENFAGGKTANFSEVAQKYSEGPATLQGGDLGYQSRSNLDPSFYEAALRLKKPGRVSEPVRSQFGLHIIELTGIHTWDESDKAGTKRMVFEDERAKIFEKYMATLRNQAGPAVKVRTELVRD